jgi:hypothetical protein
MLVELFKLLKRSAHQYSDELGSSFLCCLVLFISVLSDGFLCDLLFLMLRSSKLKVFPSPGDGSSRESRTSRSSFEPKISADEMEFLRKVLPPDEPAVLQHFSCLHHDLLVAAHAQWKGKKVNRSKVNQVLMMTSTR